MFFIRTPTFCFMIYWIFLLNISHCWTTISRFIIHIFVICIQTNLKQLFFFIVIDSIKRSFCELSHLNLNVLCVYSTWGISLNESYNRFINYMFKYLNKSQLKTNFNIYVFFIRYRFTSTSVPVCPGWASCSITEWLPCNWKLWKMSRFENFI